MFLLPNMGLLGGKFGVYLGLVVVGLIALAVVARNWSCRQQRPPRPPLSRSYTVESCSNGASINVSSGLRGRRTATIALDGIAAPPFGEALAEESRKNLEKLAGKVVRVETARHGLFRGTADESDPAADELVQPDVYELGPGDLAGIVYGESGANLNLEQLRAGLATCEPSAAKDFRAAQSEAKKARRGMWGK